ncbi:MAG: HU family DNA-binding protein [Candidatus Neomarinimicrobiota bacterium]
MSEKITFQELVDRIAAETGISKHLAQDLIKEFAAVIEEGLIRDGKVRIAQLGTFRLHRVPETTGINPQTGASLVIPEHTRVLFRPAQALARRVNREYNHMNAKPLTGQTAEPDEPESTTEPEKTAEPTKEPTAKPSRRIPTATIAIAVAAVIVVVVVALLIFRGGEEEPAPPPAVETPAAEPVQPPIVEKPVVEGVPPITEPLPPPVAEKPAPPPEAIPAARPTEPTPPSYWAQGIKAYVHTVKRNDNWWNLAKLYYQDVLYWPNLYRANSSKLRNPDLLFVGIEILIPSLEGPPQQLTAMDSLDLATGYYEAYRAYERLGKHDASDYLRASGRFK